MISTKLVIKTIDDVLKKVLNSSRLVKKTNYNMKITEIDDATSFTTTPKFKRFTKLSFSARIKEAVKNLATESKVKNAIDKREK